MKDFDYSISDISKISGVGFKTTLNIVHKLEDLLSYRLIKHKYLASSTKEVTVPLEKLMAMSCFLL